MQSLKTFVCIHPYFSMLVFVGIGVLIKSIRRINFKLIKLKLEDLELALEDKDLERAQSLLQQLKTGLGL